MAVLKDLIVHGKSHFINTAAFNGLSANTIGADRGIFNKLIATQAGIGQGVDIDNLGSADLTVVGMLDVQGELHTKSWSNANIANIGGSFYIAPTIKSDATTVTIAVSGTTYSLTVNGGNFNSTAMGITWSLDSKVMVTGTVEYNNVKYPLGTLVGNLSAKSNTGFTINQMSSTATPKQSGALAEIYAVVETNTMTGKDIQLSLYALPTNKPIGILMTSHGASDQTYLDIYGGGIETTDTTQNLPNVRLGFLGGLKGFQNSAGVTITPGNVWGLYTDSGYFKGTIFADSGLIGGFDIGTTVIKNTKTSYSETTNDGVWLGTDGIGLGKGLFYVTKAGALTAKSGTIGGWNISATALCSATTYTPASGRILLAPGGVTTSSAIGNLPAATYAITAGTNFGVTTAGALYASSGKIGGFDIGTTYLRNGNITSATNTSVAGIYLGTDGLNISNGTAATTSYITKTAVNIGNKLTWNGTTLTIDGSASIGGTTASTVVSNAANGAAAKIGLDNLQIGGRNLLRNTTDASIMKTMSIDSSSSSSYTEGWTASVARIQGEDTYTVSFDAKADTNGTVAVCHWYNPNTTTSCTSSTGYSSTSSGNDGYSTVTLTTEWKRYWVTWTQSDVANTNKSLIICRVHRPSSGTATVYVKGIKFETGNKATAWTHAPEDVQAEIDKKKSVWTINSAYLSTGTSYETILGYATEGASTTFSIESTTDLSNIKVGDTIRLCYTVSNMNLAKVYIIGEATAINNSAHQITMIGHGLDTTVIDGGHILTGTIDANSVNISNLTVGSALSGWSGVLNDNIDIGGKNLLTGSNKYQESTPWILTTTAKDGYAYDYSIITNIQVHTGEIYIFQAKTDGTWAASHGSQANTNVGVWLVGTTNKSSAAAHLFLSTTSTTPALYLGNGKWKWTVPAEWDGYYICIRVNNYNTDGTTSTTHRYWDFKLEKGNKVTAWSPAPEDLDVHKYVTDIDTNKGITIKPLTSTGNDYLQINSTSIDFYRGIGTNSAAVSVMSLSDSVFRMGKSDAQRVEVTASAVDMYDKNNKLTTRVNENGLTIYKAGTQVASYGTDATIGQVAANLYNVFIDADSGIALRKNTTSLLTINSNQLDINNSSGNVITRVDSSGLTVFDGSGIADSNKMATFGSTTTIGVTSGNKYNIYIDGNAVNLRYNTNVLNEITADGMKLYLSDDNINSIAEFGETTRIGKEIGAYISVGGDNIRGNSADGEYFSISGTGGIITSKATLAQFAINVNISNYTTGLATYTSWSNIATGDIVYVKIEYTYTYKYNNNTYTTTKIISSNFVKGTSRTTDYFTYTSPATFASAKGGPLPSVPSAATNLKMTKKFVILTYMHERSAPLYRFGDDVAAEGGAYSFLTGLGTVSAEPYQLVCGKYNADVGSGITAFDAPFVIGNGTGSDPSERSNAFAVDLLGRVYMGNVIYMYPLADKDKSNTRIMCYNNPSTGTVDNYGCLGFQAESTVSGKPAYFAFWTQSPGTNSGSQTGRFYITETSVYTANSTPFTSAGKLTVSNSTNNAGATIYGATTITGNVSITSSTTTSLISNGRIYANTNAAASYGMFLGRGYSDGAFTTNRGLYDLKKGDWALHINGDGQTYLDIAGKESEVSYTANVYMSTAGHIVRRSGSSKRFKHNIIAIKDTELDPHKLYDLKVVQFNYNTDYLSQSDWRAKLNIPGFIAEDVAEIYPIAAEHDEEGKICDWGERYIIPPMLKLIQEQKKEIEQLKKEVQELKNK